MVFLETVGRWARSNQPRQMGGAEVRALLSHLAVDLQVSTSTQSQAMAVLLFL